MNRQAKREMDRKLEKDRKFLSRLPKDAIFKINNMVKTITDNQTKMYAEMIDRNLTATLIEEGYTFKEVTVFMDKMEKNILEDTIKTNKLEKENIDMNKLQEDFREYMIELIKGDMDKKEVIDKALFKFPKLSRTAISNAYARIKDELETEKAAAYIVEEAREVKTKEIAKEKVGMKEVKGAKKTNESKLKIIESLVKVQGEYGIYTIENYKVKINDMEIGNIQEMDSFAKQLELEDGKKIEKLVQELTKVREDKIKELEEVIGMV